MKVSVAARTLEEYQTAVSPSEAEGSKALRTNHRVPGYALRTTLVSSVRTEASSDRTISHCYARVLDFSTPLEKTV